MLSCKMLNGLVVSLRRELGQRNCFSPLHPLRLHVFNVHPSNLINSSINIIILHSFVGSVVILRVPTFLDLYKSTQLFHERIYRMVHLATVFNRDHVPSNERSNSYASSAHEAPHLAKLHVC